MKNAKKKFTATSRHKWYTLSGIISRAVAFLAARWAESPNDLFPVAVFAYGLVELFGVQHGAKLLVRFHALQSKKLRKQTRVSNPSVASTSFVGGRPRR